MDKAFWNSVFRFILVTIAIISLFIGMYYILPLIYPFLIGIIFALIMNPFVDLLESKARFPRWLAVTLSIILFLGVIVSLVVLVVIEIANEITNLQRLLPHYIEDYIIQLQTFIVDDILTIYEQFSVFYSSLDLELQRNIETQINNFTDQLVNLGQTSVKEIFNSLFTIIGAIPTIATAFIISLLASFFISKDWPRLREKFIHVAPDRIHMSGGAVLRDLRRALFGFMKAQLTLISITFVIVLIGFIILKVEYGLTIAIVIALVDLLPYIGTGLVFIPWILYLFLSGEYSMVIGLSILYGVILIQRQMMEPKILGTNVGLDPLLTLVALFVGFKLFGLTGLIIGPVFMVVISAMHRAGVFRDLWFFIRKA